MSSKQMKIDVRSSIAHSFYEFSRGYCLFQVINKIKDGVEYVLTLKCNDSDTSVLISVKSSDGLNSSNIYSMDTVMSDKHLIMIVESFQKIDVDIDMFTVHFTNDGLISISLNMDEESLENKGSYVINQETGKVELYFDKESYQNLSDDEKASIRSNYLFSRGKKAWVSRAKMPNIWRALEVAKSLGLIDKGRSGERISFEEQMERKAERAESRAQRYEDRAEKAVKRADQLQKPINDMHGDTAFFTQPNINSSAGRAFSNRRSKMFDAYEKGFDEFKKSEYYKDRAEAARATASGTKPTDKGFCQRRIEEAEKIIRAQKKNLDHYEALLERVRKGEIIKRYSGEAITETMLYGWIDSTEDIIEQNISKSIYYHDCIDSLGGIDFSKENIRKGYIVELKRWGRCRVIGVGPKNIKYEILDGGAAGMGGVASYAEIQKVLEKKEPEEQEIRHPFKVGDSYTVMEWDGNSYVPKEYKVLKVTFDRVTLKCGTNRAINRSPRRFRSGEANKGYMWALGICDGRNGTVYKEEE